MNVALVLPRIVALLLLTAAPAAATDYYVDAVSGDDANGGTSPGDAWRHLSFALSVVQPGDHVVHLAPGVYDAAGGEVFPLPIRSGVLIFGDGGSEVTRIEGGGFRASGTDPTTSVFDVRLRGLTLAGGTDGVYIFFQNGPYSSGAQLEDVVVRDMSGMGVFVDAYGELGGFEEDASAYLDSVRIEDCGSYGVFVQAGHPEGAAFASVHLVDSTVRDCHATGVWARSSGDDGDAWATVERSRLSGNSGWGLDVEGGSSGSSRADLSDSLVDGNGPGGVNASGSGEGRVNLLRCTIADNTGAGLWFNGADEVDLTSSILYGNGDQVFGTSAVVAARFCCVDDPDVPPHPTNIAGDPRFVDAAAGDFRLRFGSRCLDAGDPATPHEPTGALDGNLDTLKAPDMGAYELAPLTVTGEPRIGGELTLDLWGPAGGRTLLYFAEAPLAPPLPTPFGELELDRSVAALLGTLATAPGPPARRFLALPDDPARIGSTWSLQGLCLGSGSQPLRALTNAVELVLLP